MKNATMTAALVLAAVSILGMAPPAAAQSNGAAATERGTEIMTNRSATSGHGLLNRLAVVYPLVTAIAAEAEPRIAEAETEAVARAIRDRTELEIIAVLAEVGLTAAEYVAAITELNEDDVLRARFRKMLEEAEAAPAGGRGP
jgi:hypothetical protein